jgi:hypothetical protein
MSSTSTFSTTTTSPPIQFAVFGFEREEIQFGFEREEIQFGFEVEEEDYHGD